MSRPVIDHLLTSEEPAIRYKIRVHVLDEDPQSQAIRTLQRQIRQSPRAAALLANRQEDGRLAPVNNVYSKWTGAHWVLASLADTGYPARDESLGPAIDQVLGCWLGPSYLRQIVADKASAQSGKKGVRIINGRARRCASQQGNGLFSAVRLGFVDDRAAATGSMYDAMAMARRRLELRPQARGGKVIVLGDANTPGGLAAYAKTTGDRKAKAAAKRAADVFLKRMLYRRCSDGEVMNRQFVRLHYPCYWRYDILFGLKVMAEAGFIGDRRCKDALDLLVSMQLPDGGWPATERFYHMGQGKTGRELISWGRVSKQHMNEWVTADALAVLKAAGRLKP